MQTLQIAIPAPLVGIRLAGPLGEEAMAAMVRSMQPVGPDQDEQLRQEFKQLLQEQKQQVASAVAAIGQAMDQFERIGQQIREEAEQELLAAALEIARKIVAQNIEAGQVQIDPILNKALSKLPARQKVRIHLNPGDLKQCQLAQSNAQADANQRYEFISDPQIQPGECLLESDDASIEHTVEDSADTIREALLGSDDE
jgi:flagellar assembly protein FliH